MVRIKGHFVNYFLKIDNFQGNISMVKNDNKDQEENNGI
jgi:hypothetical protein